MFKELILNVDNEVKLHSLLTKAREIQARCFDYTLSDFKPSTVCYKDGSLMFVNPENPNAIGQDRKVMSFMMSRYSLGQLCNKLGIPYRYVDKCYKSGESALVDSNINTWLTSYNKPLFVRTCGDVVRGVLSNRFTTFDTPNILESLEHSGVFDSLEIKGFFLTPERFHLRAVYPDMIKVPGEDLFSGIQIDSSDVGRSTCTVKFFVFKQICTNGLCINKLGGSLFTQRHIGMSIKEFEKAFVESLDRVPELVAITESKINEAREVPCFLSYDDVTKDLAIESIQKQTGLSKENSDKVYNLIDSKYGYTKWGYVNSLTEIAQEFTLERRLDIENMAGEILVA